MLPGYSITPLGDRALVLSYGNDFSLEKYEQVLTAFRLLRKSTIGFITDLVPAYTSLGVIYDPVLAARAYGEDIYSNVVSRIEQELTVGVNRNEAKVRRLRIPVCYHGKYAPDLHLIAEAGGMSTESVIELHSSATYTVFMLGFLPGFAYMGMVDDRIAHPRRSSPRPLVEKGSIGIAGRQTGIYPADSPGGWNIIGRTKTALFDPDSDPPSFFQPGDEVTFYPVSPDEFENS